MEVVRCTVECLMQRLGLCGVRRRKVVRTTVSDNKGAAGGYCSLVSIQLALHLAHHHPQDRSQALDRVAQELELLGVEIAACLSPKSLALPGDGLLEPGARMLSRAHHLATGDLQQTAVHRVGDDLGPHNQVDDSRAPDQPAAPL